MTDSEKKLRIAVAKLESEKANATGYARGAYTRALHRIHVLLTEQNVPPEAVLQMTDEEWQRDASVGRKALAVIRSVIPYPFAPVEDEVKVETPRFSDMELISFKLSDIRHRIDQLDGTYRAIGIDVFPRGKTGIVVAAFDSELESLIERDLANVCQDYVDGEAEQWRQEMADDIKARLQHIIDNLKPTITGKDQ